MALTSPDGCVCWRCALASILYLCNFPKFFWKEIGSKSNVRSLVQMALIQCCKCVEIQARHAAIVNSKKAISNTVTNMK